MTLSGALWKEAPGGCFGNGQLGLRPEGKGVLLKSSGGYRREGQALAPGCSGTKKEEEAENEVRGLPEGQDVGREETEVRDDPGSPRGTSSFVRTDGRARAGEGARGAMLNTASCKFLLDLQVETACVDLGYRGSDGRSVSQARRRWKELSGSYPGAWGQRGLDDAAGNCALEGPLLRVSRPK